MKKKETKKTIPEDKADLKKEAVADDSVKKGYNEKNPAQPQGAFKPDNDSTKN